MCWQLTAGNIRKVPEANYGGHHQKCGCQWIFFFFFFFFFFGTFFRLQYPRGSLCTAPQLQPTRMGRRLLAGVACQRASARSSCRPGSGPPALHSPPGGNSSRDAAKARCAATARMPLHLTTHAALAAARREVGTSAARARASKRMKVAASGSESNRPCNLALKSPITINGPCCERDSNHCASFW